MSDLSLSLVSPSFWNYPSEDSSMYICMIIYVICLTPHAMVVFCKLRNFSRSWLMTKTLVRMCSMEIYHSLIWPQQKSKQLAQEIFHLVY